MRRIMSDDGFLFAPVDARPMRAFRACFGMLMVVHVLRLYVHGMYERAVLQPAFRFHYELFGVELVPLLPSTIAGAHCHLLVLAVAAFGVAVGIATRMCAATFATAYAAFILSDRTIFNNHYYLYWLMAMLFVLIGGDRRPASEAAIARATTAPRWQILTLRAQVVIVYAYAGVAKLNADWLLHSQPMATKLVDEAAVYTPRLRPLLEMHACHQLISLGGAVFDLAVGPCLLLPATRPAALFLACLFHASNHFLWSLGEFPWVMLATNLLFLDHWPEWLELAQVAGRHSSAPASETARATGAAPGWAARAQVWAALLHTVTQLLLPLRPLAVSGLDPLDAVHTKAHTLLSWRMMAVSTRNFVNVSLRSEALGGSMLMTRTYNRMHLRFSNGSRVPLALSPYLSARQAGYMPYTAPMLVAFARDAARRHGCVKGRAPGGTAHTAAAGLTCRVEADLWSSINGRPLQRFVEATEDLAAATIGAAARPRWVLPLLYEFGNTTWRRRIAWLRASVARAGATVAVFADVVGGVFNETFPAVHPFPARALLVPLHGRIALDVAAHGRGPAAAVTVAVLDPPRWRHHGVAGGGGGGGGEVGVAEEGSQPLAEGPALPLMEPMSAPVEVPFGAPHAVRTLDDRACWAYVFGVTEAAAK